jgi:hypothetical protein
MTLVVVDRDALDRLLVRAWSMFTLLADESGYSEVNLEPSSELVTLAVQAGLRIPGPLAPDTLPPAPPVYFGRLTAPTYRDADGDSLRCTECGKVVYGNKKQAGKAAAQIAERQEMRTYLGGCGHWHLSRDKRKHGAAVARALEGK